MGLTLPQDDTGFGSDGDEDPEPIPLEDTEEVPIHRLRPTEDKNVRLSAFQCVICMDDVKDLAVTFCGKNWSLPRSPLGCPRPVYLGPSSLCLRTETDMMFLPPGHLFCSECLHSSLIIDATRKICPICRQKIDIRQPSSSAKAPSKTYWPLELQLMTATRKGKRRG